MKNYLQRSYWETKAKYEKFRRRLDRKIKNGSFYQLSAKKQRQLVDRVKKLFEKLKELQLALKLGTAGLTAALALSFGNASGQEVKQQDHLKIFKKIEKGHHPRKMATAKSKDDLFVQVRGAENPFGGSNPFDGLNPGDGFANIVDMDDDGKLDVVLGTWIYPPDDYEYGGIKYFQNTGDQELAELEELTGGDNPFNALEFYSAPVMRLVDLDNDGDLDLIATDEWEDNYYWYQGFRYFKNEGSTANPDFQEQTGFDNPFDDIEYDDYALSSFVDIDGDGDQDMFFGAYEYMDGSGWTDFVRFFENTGTASAPAFEERTGVDNPMGEFSNPGDYDMMPVFSDFDGDGDYDAIIGDDDYGYFNYYKNIGTASDPDFEEQFGSENPFDDVFIGGDFDAEIIDYDADGDMDVFTHDTDAGFILYFENTGSAANPVLENQSGDIRGYYFASPEFADLDGDGDLDLVLGTYGYDDKSYESILYFENTGTASNPVYEEQMGNDNPFSTLDNFYYSFPALVDIDNDGDFDMFNIKEKETEYGYATMGFYKNIGSATSPEFMDQTGNDNPLDGVEFDELAIADFADIDGDGDYDCFIGTYDDANEEGVILFYRNIGTADAPEFAEATNPLPGDLGYTYVISPVFADVDADGDLDCVVGMYLEGYYQGSYFEGGILKYFENNGTVTEPDFQEQIGVDNPFNDLVPFSYFYFPDFADLDDDGDQDLLVGMYGGGVLYFKNTTDPVSAMDNDLTKSFEIYPNPSNGMIKIDLENNSNLDVNIKLYDYLGKQIEVHNFESNKIELDISHLPSGMYFMKIKQGESISSAKMIKE